MPTPTTLGTFVVVICLLASASVPAQGVSYYVSASAGNDLNAGTSPAAPWQSLARASNAPLLPGDRVLLRADDTWAGEFVVGWSGSPTDPIIVGRYGVGAPPVIDGGSSMTTGAVYLDLRTDVIIEDLHLIGGQNTVEFRVCDRVVVRRCEIELASNYGVVALWQPGIATIEDCHIHHCENDAVNAYVTAVNVRGCNIHDLGTTLLAVDGIALHDSFWPVSEISGNTIVGPFTKAGINGSRGPSGQGSRFVAHSNFISGRSKRAIGVYGLGSVGTAYNNVIVIAPDAANLGGGIVVVDQATLTAHNNTIVNLNVVDAGPSFLADQAWNVDVRNNISYCASAESMHWVLNSTAAALMERNLYWPDDDPLSIGGRFDVNTTEIDFAAWENLGHDPTGLVADPQFQGSVSSMTATGARLQFGSPARDAGEDLSSFFTVDFSGNPRPFGGAWDIGAWEFSVPTPALSMTQPGGPGTPLIIENTGLTVGNEYFNVFSPEPCPGPVGSGIFLGLCATNPAFLIAQVQAPVGAAPFHFIANQGAVTWAPVSVPPLTLDAVCFDFTGTQLGPVAPVVRVAIQ
ncbi:MAG: hypothetical protein CMJ83_04145 [Planctomycetes bacterium]|nr:hypothetical protein [Planctomycetota bacterium]